MPASTIGSAAHATAIGSGADGGVTARAQSYGGAVVQMVASSDASLRNNSSAESRVGVGSAAATLTQSRQAFALATALPLASDVETATLGHDDATVAFTMNDPQMLALGLLGSAFAETAAGGSLTSVAALQLSIDTAQLIDPRNLLVGFVNPEITGAGFTSLQFTLEFEDDLLFDVTFTDAAAALAYFEDRVFDLGAIDPSVPPPDLEMPTLDVTARFTVTTSAPGDGFSTQALVANNVVPEPASTLLLALGGAALTLRRRRVP